MVQEAVDCRSYSTELPVYLCEQSACLVAPHQTEHHWGVQEQKYVWTVTVPELAGEEATREDED